MPYDSNKAKRALDFIGQLKHTKGKWKGVPFTTLAWQAEVLQDVFGTIKESGYRQYKTVYLEIPKKQGKSELGAVIALQGLCADGEWSAEVYGCAADRGQASIIFDVAVDMVDQEPRLKKHIKPVISQKRLIYLPTNSFYQVLSAEAYSKHGLNVSRCVFDELHAQPKRDLYDVMTEGSGDARTQPLYFFITTAGDDPDHKSIGWEVHQTAVNILTGIKHDPTFYAMIYGLDRDEKRIWSGREFESIEADLTKEDEWRHLWSDPETWTKINPSINHTVPMDVVNEHFVSASGNLIKERNFRWLRLNSWEKIKHSKWMGLDFWDRCKGAVNKARLKSRVCYGGLDLSTKIDMTSFVLLFPPDEINKNWVVLAWFWVPEERVRERVDSDHVSYDVWVDQGYLQTTPGNAIDYDFIELEIIKAAKDYKIKQIGYDPWNAMQTAIRMQDAGINMVEVRQGYKSMSEPMKELEKLARGMEILHDGNPVLRWNVGNTEKKEDENENIRPVKGPKIERIDGVIGMICAMNRALLDQEKESVYKKRGVRWA